MHTTFVGRFVSVESKSWDSFDDDSGNAVVGGESHSFYVLAADGEAPQKVKIFGGSNGQPLDKANLDEVRKFGFGVEVEVQCTVKARGRNLALTLVRIAPARKAA